MRALMALTLCLALLAGCSDSPAGEPAPAAADAADAAAGPAAASSAAPQPAARPTSFDAVWMNGQTQTGACFGVSGVDSECNSIQGQSTFAMLGPGTDLVRLTGNLTWTATSPATETLFIMMLACDDVQGSDCQNSGEYPYASGTSPLSIDWDLTNETEQPFALWVVHYLGQGASGSYVTGMAPQAFSFEGTLERTS